MIKFILFLYFVSIGSIFLKEKSQIDLSKPSNNKIQQNNTQDDSFLNINSQLPVVFNKSNINTVNYYAKGIKLIPVKEDINKEEETEKIRKELEAELKEEFIKEKEEFIKEKEEFIKEKEEFIKEKEEELTETFNEEKEIKKEIKKEILETDKEAIEELINGKKFLISNGLNTNLYWGIAGGGKNDGDTLFLWPKTGSKNQQFRFEKIGDGYYAITDVNSGKGMAVANLSTDYGAEIHQFENKKKAHQIFKVIEAQGPYIEGLLGPFYIADLNNDGKRYLGVEIAKEASPIITMDNSGSDNELWYFEEA